MVSNIMNEVFQTSSPWMTFLIIINLILCLYPILGAMFWFFGALSYMTFRHEEELPAKAVLKDEPFITIMIPAHNEEVVIQDTLEYLLNDLNYHNYEVLVMDDGSTDKTPQILHQMQQRYPKLRVIRIEENQGKAHAFNIGIFFTKGDYILSNDADTIPEKDALIKYMQYFTSPAGLNYAAITANMDVYNRSTLWGKSQTVEFSSIVGIIKRSQTALNNTMYAYSGANTMYRRSFLIDVGGFRQDRATEDISIAWDHTFMNVTPKFAPDIVFHMNVPESFHDLYRQRKRWAQGGTEVWLTNFTKVLRHPWQHRFVLSMFADTTLSIIWSFFFWITSIIFVLLMIHFAVTGNYERVWHGIAMSMIFINFQLIAGLFQVLAALILDFDGAKLRYLMFSPIYLLFTWIVNPLTIVTTCLKAIKAVESGSAQKGRPVAMTDLIILLWWTFVWFTVICIGLCISAYFRYRLKTGIDDEHGFVNKYEYFGQPIYDHEGKLHGYELLLREFNQRKKHWQLPKDVADFPLSKVVYTIRQIDPQIIDNIQMLALNMTVSQITDFRAAYFFKWVRGVINNQQLTIEVDAADIRRASPYKRWQMRSLLKKLDHTTVKVTIEDVDSTQRTYVMLRPFLPYIDYLKFNINSFEKSANHWIDITLAQWQRRAEKYGIVATVSKVEEADQVQLADQLGISLRQGYAYGQPDRVQAESKLAKEK